MTVATKPKAKPKADETQDESSNVVDRQRRRSAAGECPRNPKHPGARVYKTKGRTRYCVCDSCGENWKTAIENDDQYTGFLIDLADLLENAGRIDNGEGQQVVVLSDEDAQLLAQEARSLVAG